MKIANIIHSQDADGWSSGSIVKKWFNTGSANNQININNDPYADILFNKNKQSSPVVPPNSTLTIIPYNRGAVPNLDEYDMVIMCDIAFQADDMNRLYKLLGNNFIWIDHHISAIKDMESIGLNDKLNGIRDIKFAACELTWKFFFPGVNIPVPIYMLGRYDCFGHKDLPIEQQDAIMAFQFYARGEASSTETIPYWWLDSYTVGNGKAGDPLTPAVKDGTVIKRYLDHEALEIYNTRKFELEIGGYKFGVVNEMRFNPVNYGIDYHNDGDGYEGFACFHYEDGMWCWSLYNEDGKVDCSQVVRSIKSNAGGHAGAAGMKLTNDEMFELLSERI